MCCAPCAGVFQTSTSWASGKRVAEARPDPDVLAWAPEEARVLLTHDVTSMTRHALERVARGEAMPGVIAVHRRLSIGSGDSRGNPLKTRSRNAKSRPLWGRLKQGLRGGDSSDLPPGFLDDSG